MGETARAATSATTEPPGDRCPHEFGSVRAEFGGGATDAAAAGHRAERDAAGGTSAAADVPESFAAIEYDFERGAAGASATVGADEGRHRVGDGRVVGSSAPSASAPPASAPSASAPVEPAPGGSVSEASAPGASVHREAAPAGGRRRAPVRTDPIGFPAGLWTIVRTVARNPLEAIPAPVYREPFLRVRALGRDTVHVASPELVRAVLLDHADSFVKSEAAQRTLVPAIGQAILTAEGARWRWQRRALAPTFRPERMLGYVPLMRARAETRSAAWRSAPGTAIDAAEEMMRITFDIVLDAMFSGADGIDVEAFAADITTAIEGTGWIVALTLLGLPEWFPYPGRRRAEAARRRLRDRVDALVRERRARPIAAADLLTRLLEAEDPETGQRMSDRDVADNVLTLMIAGHETTALALTWSLYLLALHPEAATRIRAEVAAVTGGGPVEAVHLDRLVFTRAVIDEAMRLYPPAPVVPRQVAEPVDLPGVGRLAVGTQVIVPVYAIHRHERIWSDPDSFDPERFLGDAARDRPRYAYLPFGAGPRICIGMSFALVEAVVVLATLVSGLRFDLAPGTEPRLKSRITLRPEPGLPMRVAPV